MFKPPSAPAAPPPPPAAPQLGANSIMQEAASERETLATAEGGGMGGTVLTSGQGASNPSTTKSVLG